jgi:SAM-dependent methyltransferase
MVNIAKETEEKLVRSLSWETTELLPFLPYLLQDFWELGSDPDVMVELINEYVSISDKTRVLDLACGKGAVSVKVAQKLRVKVKGIDLMPEFIEYAVQKAKEYDVDNLCEFLIDDINEAVKTERDYDCVVFGAAGVDVLGGAEEALNKLKGTVIPGGYILIEEGYIPDESNRENVRHNNEIYLFKQQWMDSFRDADLELIETATGHSEGDLDSDSGMAAIIARTNELIEKYPDKKNMFEDYVCCQQNEYDDIDDSLECVTWMLRKRVI